MAKVYDSATGITTTYYYDLTGRQMKYTESGTGYSHTVGYEYDSLNNLTELVESINGTERTTAYTYDDDNRIATSTTGNITVEYDYDSFGRIETQTTKNGSTVVLTESYTYKAPTSTTTSAQIATYTTAVPNGYSITYTYTYDDNGNITSISDGTNTTSYEYDSANQLLRENNQAGNYTHTWNYDEAGNILSRKEYSYTTESLDGVTPTYTANNSYNDSNWGDLLTAYDDDTITYDQIGNPLDDLNWTYTWEHGRQLSSMSDGRTTWTYTYDANGMRTQRTNGTTTYKYYYNGSQLSRMTFGNTTLDFTYDANGIPLTITRNGEVYYYVTNLQGDVVGILNDSGTLVADYVYDAWGNFQSNGSDDIDLYNPLTYRGYVYDRETGLYYLQSRYYNPKWGRFINADGLIDIRGITTSNLFAYCANNPVIFADYNGNVFGLIGAVCVIVGVALLLGGCSTPAPISTMPTAPSTEPPTTVAPTTAPVNDYDDFLDALAMSESSGIQNNVNEYGYQGLYQMGSLALQDAGFKNSTGDWTNFANSHGVYSETDFLNNSAAQKVAVTNYHKKICGYIRYYDMEKYIGTSYQGVVVTYSGLLAACHLVGSKSMAGALSTGSIITDGNGTSASYYLAIFAGYDISKVWN